MKNQNLLENAFLGETLEELMDILDEVKDLKKRYAPGSVRRRKAVEAEYQVEQILELFQAAKEANMYIDEDTTAQELIEERFGDTLDNLLKQQKSSGASYTWKKTTEIAGTAVDKGFDLLGKFGYWLGDVTSKRK